MKSTNKILMTMLILGSSVWMAAAQSPDGPPADGQRPPPPDGGPPNGAPPGGPGMRRHHRPPPLPLVLALDTNHDGIIDANEIANASAALKTLDRNGDGQLTPDEYMPPRPPQGRPGGGTNLPPMPPIVAALDLNHDGIIDADEIAQASESLKKLDKNGDGRLTRDEFAPPPPPGFNGPMGQRGPQGTPQGAGGPDCPPPAGEKTGSAPPQPPQP